MADTYWLRQAADEPLFPDVLWSRPENKRSAGKLLIVGGNLHSFAAVSKAYADAIKAGIGTARAILPDALAKTLGKIFPEAEFSTSTPSGSFARTALDQLLDSAAWGDGVLLAGDFGKNSETAILLETFVQKYSGPLTITGDSVDYFISNHDLLARTKTTLALEFSQLQKLMSNQGRAVKSSMDLAQLVSSLHNWTEGVSVGIVCSHSGQSICAHGGQIATMTGLRALGELATHIGVWQLWQPAKPFESFSCAIYELETKGA